MGNIFQTLLLQLKSRIEANPELSPIGLTELARPSVRLTAKRIQSTSIGMGESRMGGFPDVPPGFQWPRWMPPKPISNRNGEVWIPDSPEALGFLAQIDLGSIPGGYDGLPKSGWLYFFYDRIWQRWGDDTCDRGSCRVFYVDCDRSSLQRIMPPSDYKEFNFSHLCRVNVSNEITLPDDLSGINEDDPVYEKYRLFRNKLYEDNSGLTHHHLLGFPQTIQFPMEPQCQLASKEINSCDLEDSPGCQISGLEAEQSDWRLLLQIDTDEEGPGWIWHDVGRIYFWIKAKDLAELNFQNVWLILQTF